MTAMYVGFYYHDKKLDSQGVEINWQQSLLFKILQKWKVCYKMNFIVAAKELLKRECLTERAQHKKEWSTPESYWKKDKSHFQI